MKRKKYQIGGPIDGYVGPVKPNPLDPITFDKSNFPPNTTLNIQTLGHIKFNSNEARSTGSADSRFVVKDILSGKDYGVIRGTDGKYQFWSKELQDSEKK